MAESKDDVSSRTILVSNVTEDFKDLLEVFVESKKKGGGNFEQFDYDKDNCIAWITFEDLEVAKRFVENGSIEIQKRQMKVQQAPDSCTLFIHQLPAGVDEILECFLESPKKGGGSISEFYIDEQSRTATVKFDSETVARNLLERKSIEIQGHELHFSKLPPICNAGNHESFAEDGEKEEVKEENEENSEEETDDGYRETVSDPDSTVLIENVPAGMIDFLECYLENESSGGGTISNFKEDEDGVLVTFEDPEVAKNLLKHGSIQFGETSLNVVPPRSSAANEDPGDQQPTSSVTISQIPRTLTASTLKAILGSKKCGGGDVLDLTLDQEQGTAVVHYQDPEVAQRLIESGRIQFKSTTLSVSSVPKTSISASPRLSLSSDASLSKDIPVFSDVPTTPEDSATVVIEKIPANCTEDTFSMLIENPKRSGGGKYTKLSFDEKDRKATVTFEDPKVAEELLKKGQVKYKEFAMSVRTPAPISRQSSENCTSLSSNSIVLTEISPGIPEETLRMFIENKKRSGIGEYESFVLDEHKRTATITLKDPQVAQDLLKRGSLKYGSFVMKIENPCSSPSTSKVGDEPNKTKNHPSESPRTVEILGHVKDRETLVLYLENRRSGGGPTEDVQILSDSRALVTFEKSEDAKKFAKKGDHSLCNSKIQVTLLDSWPNVGGSCAIRVEGFKKGTPRDTLMYFFENKRSGGEPESIEEIHYDGSSQTAVITFKTPSVVRNIIGKGTITLDSCNLDIVALKPARPPPLMLSNNIDSKKLLFTELGLDVDASKLRRFAEAAGKASVVDVSFCTKPGVALIQYANVPDYCHVREVLCSKPFQGQMISVQRIPIPTSIQVHNIGKLTDETLTLYFESRRSGGGEIKKLEMRQQDNCAVIEFQNTNVIESVLARNHKVSDQDLDVKPFIDSIGLIPPGFDSSVPFQKLPPDIDVTCNYDIVTFIRKNVNLKKEIEHQMKLKHCFVNWPRNRDDPAKLHCTIPPGQSNLIKSWKDAAEQQFCKEMEKYVFKKIIILQEVWKKFKKALDTGYQKPKEEELLLCFDKSSSIVLMCGLKSHAELYEKCVNEVKAQLEEELERSKKEIKDEAGLKPYQLYLLKAANFFNQPSNDVRCQETDRGVVFEGQPNAVRAAKLQMYQQFLNDIVETSIDHENFVKLLNHSKVRSHLHNCFQRMNVAATFEVVNNDVKIFGNGQTSVDVAEKVLKEEVIQFPINLDKSSRDCIQTREWDFFRAGLIQEFETLDILENKDGVIFVTLKDQAADVKEKAERYFDKNAIISQFLPMDKGVAEVLKRCAERDMERVKTENKQNEIDIKLVLDSKKCGCSISGNRKGLEHAVKAVKELINKVLKDKYPVDKVGAIKFFQSEHTKYVIQGIADKNSVFVQFSSDDNGGHGKDNNSHGKIFHGDPILYSHVLVRQSQASVKLFLGDITRVEGDTIINAANSRMEPGSGVAGAIAEAGGYEIQRECSEHVRLYGELRPGKVYVSRPGKLKHKSVIHTVGPIWNQVYPKKANDELKAAVFSALIEADTRMNKSVVMPLISCGVYGFPAEKAAQIISDTVVEFLEVSANLKEVYIVNGDKAKLDITEKALIQNSGVLMLQKASATSVKSTFDSKSPAKSRTSSSQQPMRFKTPEGISVELILGSIADHKADVLFDSTEKDMDLSKAAVSKSMLSIAGPELQSECKSKCPAGGISYGEIIKTAGYRLPCKAVYHSACPRWDEGKGYSEKCIRKMLSDALNMAEKDGMTSIAFPAIGTGKLRFPGRVVATAMFEEVTRFSKSARSPSVNDVRIVIFDKQTIDDFVKELKSLSGGDNSSSEDDSSSYQRHSSAGNSSPHSRPHRRHVDSSASSSTSSEVSNFDCTMNDVSFEVKFGDITREKCDAIVNSTNQRLNLSTGALSKAIVRAAGDSVEDECKKLGKVTDGMAITGAGRLQCKHIFHLVAKDVKEWKTVIDNMLTEAEKMKLTSLTMPPLGTGHRTASVDDMAEAIMDVVYDFSKTKPKHLRKISIAIRDREMLNTFASAVEKAGKKQGNFFKKFVANIQQAGKDLRDFVVGSHSSDEEEAGSTTKSKYKKPVHEKVHEKRHENQKFELIIYGLDRRNIESTKRDLQKLGQTAEIELILDKPAIKEAVAKITEDQKRKFKELEREHSVKIVCGTDYIKLIGDGDGTTKAIPKIYDIIMSVMVSEKETRELQLFAKNAIWKFQENGKMEEYGKYATGTIERAYHEKKKSVDWTSKKGNVKHSIDFKTMTDNRQPGGATKVTRTVPGSVVIPSRWDQMPPDKVYIKVEVKPGSEEYKTVSNNLTSTAQNTVQSVIKIERIQNPGLYRQYMNRKQYMDGANAKAGVTNNERRLWHGTGPTNIENINSRNFNRSYCGQHGVAIGNGVYFAVGSAYSVQGYCRADGAGNKYIYQARVLTGQTTRGAGGLKEPPALPGRTDATYDSVCDNPAAPSMFVVFYDYQTYPEYLITFK